MHGHTGCLLLAGSPSCASMCILQLYCIAVTSDVFLFYRGIAVFFHPQLSLHQQVPSLTDLRGWLLMAYDIMHVTVESKHHTMQGGAVITSITNVLMSAGIHAATLYQLLQWR